jgi:zeaxanthin glucosyltransferase
LAASRSRIVFLTYHGTGHFNACLRVAKILREKYDVVFAGVQFFQQYMTDQGFQYYPLTTVPFGLGLEEWMNSVQKRTPLYFHTLRDRWQNRLYHLRKKDLDTMLDDLDPTLILLDAQQSTDFIILYPELKKRSIRLALFHAMLPTTLAEGLPPINSLVLPGNKQEVKRAQRTAWIEKLKKHGPQKLKFFGADDPMIIRRNIKRNRIPPQYLLRELSAFNYVVTGVHELILTSRQLDFAEARITPYHHYIGSCIDFSRLDAADPAYLAVRDTIMNTAKEKQLSLIYCSFGTLPQRDQALVVRFLQKLIEATRDQNYLLLIAQKLEPGHELNAAHVHIFNYLPQLDVLSRVNLFITHGGLNSVKESIALNVPMLVYPIETKADHYGNSSRVVHHGAGLRGNTETDTIPEIKKKISELLTNPVYKENIRRLNEGKDCSAEEVLSLVSSIPLLD